MNANAMEMNEATPASSSRPSAAARGIAKLKELLPTLMPDVIKEYDHFKKSSVATTPIKDGYSALYNLIRTISMALTPDWSWYGIEFNFMPSFLRALRQICQIEEQEPCTWKGLSARTHDEWRRLFRSSLDFVVAVMYLATGERATFKNTDDLSTRCLDLVSYSNVDDCTPYFDIISILKANGKTLAETFPRPAFDHKFCLKACKGEGWEEEYIEQMHKLERLHEAGLIKRIRFCLEERLLPFLQRLNLKVCPVLNIVEFYGRNGVASTMPFDKLECVKVIGIVVLKHIRFTDNKAFGDFLIKHKVKSVMMRRDVTIDQATVCDTSHLSRSSITSLINYDIKSFAEAKSWLGRAPKTVEHIGLGLPTFSPEEKGEMFRTVFEFLPNLRSLTLKRGDVKFGLKGVIYMVLCPSLEEIDLDVGPSLYLDDHYSDKAIGWKLEDVIRRENIDKYPTALVNMLMGVRKYRKILKNPLENVDFLMQKLTQVSELQNNLPSDYEIDKHFEKATRKFREAVEKSYDEHKKRFDRVDEEMPLDDSVKISNDDFRQVIQQEYIPLMDELLK